MRRNRMLLCLLLGIAIVFYGVPYLNFSDNMNTAIFAVAWLLFALFAIGGNLISIMYLRRQKQTRTIRQKIVTQRKQKIRNYG